MPSADRFELKQFKQYKRKLEAVSAKLLPEAVAETINLVAGFAHVDSIRNVRREFTLRNRYTENSIRFYKASPKQDWKKINAVTGSVSDYMDEQDQGGFRLPKHGSKVSEATLAARGGNPKAVVRKRFAAGQLGSKQFIGVPRGRVGGAERPFGVYQRNRGNKYLVMIRNITRVRVPIKGRHWHTNAVEFRARREVMTRTFIQVAERLLAQADR